MKRLPSLVALICSLPVAFHPPAAADVGDVVHSITHPGPWGHGLTWDGDHLLLWSSDYERDVLYQLDPADGTIVHSLDAPGPDPQGLAWDGAYLWYADSIWASTDTLIVQMDPADGTIQNSFDAPNSEPMGLTWDGQYLWNVDWGAATIYKLDPADGTVVNSFASPGSKPYGIAWDGQYLWHSDWGTNLIYKLDPADGTVLDSFAAPGDYAFGLAFDGRYLWNLDYPSTIYQIDIGVREPVEIDIKPGSCPNSWNRESNGVLPVAILGTEDFDVTEIDVSSVTIGRADGTGGSAAPNEGPPGPHSEFEDVGTPIEGDVCDCHEARADGIIDLSLKFKTRHVADLLPVDDPNGASIPLVVSGTFLDGTEFTSRSDCVRLVPPGSPPNQVIVESIPGAWTDATPLDDTLEGGGFGSFQRAYPHATVLTLTAAPGHNGIPFVGWEVDGGELVEERAVTLVVNNAEHVAKAVFKRFGSCGLGFELVLLVPPFSWLYGRRKRTSA